MDGAGWLPGEKATITYSAVFSFGFISQSQSVQMLQNQKQRQLGKKMQGSHEAPKGATGREGGGEDVK